MPKATKNRGHAHEDTGVEVLLAGPAIAGAKHVYDIWKEGHPEVKPSDPLTFAVLDSVSQNDRHTLTVLCDNLGVHGVYVDSFTMTDPKGVDIRAKVIPMADTILEPRGPGPSFDTAAPAAKKSSSPAIRIPPGKRACLEVEFGRFSPQRMEKKPFGKFEVHYTVAGVADNDLKKSVEFSVRP